MMTRGPFALLTIPLLLACSPGNEPSNVQTFDLTVVWNLETNFVDGGGHQAQFTIQNNSEIELTAANWELYWNMAPREVDPASITSPVTIEWISGDFFVMRPTDGFSLPPGAEITIPYQGSWSVIKESDAPVGLYLVMRAEDGTAEPYLIRDYSIAPFEGPDQINRGPGDREPIPTAAWLFDQHSIIARLPEEQVQLIVPTPRSVTLGDGYLEVDATTTVYYEPGLQSEAELLAGFLDG